MPTLKELSETTASKAIINRIAKQFGKGGEINIDIEIAIKMPESRLFNELAKNRGKGKPHSLKHYPKHEGDKKNS
jgi:hypothetical protein